MPAGATAALGANVATDGRSARTRPCSLGNEDTTPWTSGRVEGSRSSGFPEEGGPRMFDLNDLEVDELPSPETEEVRRWVAA